MTRYGSRQNCQGSALIFLKAEDQDPDRYAGNPDDEREDERSAADRKADAASFTCMLRTYF